MAKAKKNKDIEQTIRETGKNIKKNVKRNWKKIAVITAIIILVVLIISFIAGLRIRFSLRDDLVINLEPADASFTITNNQDQTFDLSVSTDNSMFCKAECNYYFYDQSSETTIDSGKITLGKKDSFNKTYALEPPRKGSGQKIYSFDIKCNDINTFLCTTSGELRERSSFIVLNYLLSPSEQKIKDEVKTKLVQSFGLINNASKDLQKLEYIKNISSIKNNMPNNLSDELSSALTETDKIFKIWSDEDYLKLNSGYINDFIKLSEKLSSDSTILFKQTMSGAEKENILIEQYNSIKNNFLDYRFVQYIDLSEAYGQLVSIKKTDYASLEIFEKDISYLSNIIQGLNETSKKNKLKGQNLISEEYSKKCYIGYCDNITNDTCSDLSNLFYEYDNNLFSAAVNVTGMQYYSYINESVKISASNESRSFYNEYCKNNTFDLPLDLKQIDIPDNLTTQDVIKNELSENLPICCVYSKCAPCCTNQECRENPMLYPVLLIHGHSLLSGNSPQPLLDMFNKIQYKMQEESYINVGTINFDLNPYNYTENEWGLSGYPIVSKASYYYDYFYSVGQYIHITRSIDNIDTYAIRLNDIINTLKYRSGKTKVNLIAHSMGGLVARRYLQIFGDKSINKLILIGTPNHGISGNVKSFCTLFGEKRECEDMYDDSILIKKLNDPNYKLGINTYTISGSGCDTDGSDGDGVVTVESSKLPDATSYIVKGKCDDTYKRGLHNDLLELGKYHATYDYIKQALSD